MSATAIRDEPVFEATLKAIIIYDDFDLAAQANAMLERAAQRAGDGTPLTRWDAKPWRVNLLTLAGITDAALTDATDAHLVVLALRNPKSPPAALLNWLEAWAAQRQEKEAALALWDGASGGGRATARAPEFAQFANRHWLSFIVDDRSLVEDKAPVFAGDLHEREVSLTPTLRHILKRPASDCYWHWGINE